MESLEFGRQEQSGWALYQPNAIDGVRNRVSFLSKFATKTPPSSLVLVAAWKLSQSQAGGFVFSTQPLTGSLDAIAKLVFPDLQGWSGDTFIAWLTSESPLDCRFVPLRWTYSPQTQVTGNNIDLPFANTRLQVIAGTKVSLSEDPSPRATFDAALLLGEGSSLPSLLSSDTASPGADLSFDPASPGGFTFESNWKLTDLFAAFADDLQRPPPGGEVRYFYHDAQPDTYRQLRYPVLPAQPGSFLFDCAMDPLAPLDGTRTNFVFQQQDLSRLAAQTFRTVSGQPVTLTPVAGAAYPRAGLYPAGRPDRDGAAAYLAPLGSFELGHPGGPAKIMCGLAGTEFLRLADGDIVEFVANQPACSASISAGGATSANGTGDAALIDATLQTSWVRIRPSGTEPPRGYYAQPEANVSYGRGTLPQHMNYPAAVSSLVATLPPEKECALPLFPMAPYGGVFELADGVMQDSTALTNFEKQVLAPIRGSKIRGATPAGPVFEREDGVALSGIWTVTPQGLLVQLNGTPSAALPTSGATAPAAGTWKSLVLARSGDQYLSFNASPVTGAVDATLASTLMRDQVFLVLNDWSRFSDISRELAVAGYNFQISPPPDSTTVDARSTVLVFKYASTVSLIDLVDSPEHWAEKETFVGGADFVKGAQATLQQALKVANDAQDPDDPDDPFADFRTRASDPAWTGVISFNGPINGNGMPADLQMLFAGIDGPLRAHSFGVQVNFISDNNGSPEISESSLFGVIHYKHVATATVTNDVEAPKADSAPPDYVFMVEELAVTIRNSAVTHFNCRVAMTVPMLFDREVTLSGGENASIPANTIVLKGAYQQHGGVGTVTFSGAEDDVFLFNPDGSRGLLRVVDEFRVTTAVLTPVAAPPRVQGQNQTIKARFSLGGLLCFSANPFGVDDPADLFSFGVHSKDAVHGLGLDNLGLEMSFELDADGKRTGAPAIEPDYSHVQVSQDSAGIRPGSLLASFPMKVTGFVHNENGLTPSFLAASPMNVVNIKGHDAGSPKFALECDLPLGSLGFLAGAHADLSSKLVLGWGPSAATPDNDAAQVMVRLLNLSAEVEGFNLEGILQVGFKDANLVRVLKTKGLITAISAADPTVITSHLHGLSTKDSIVITESDSDPSINGIQTVTWLSADTFTVPVRVTTAGTEGDWTQDVYVALFNNVALKLLGITFPPNVLANFLLMAGTEDPAHQNIAWYLAAAQSGGGDNGGKS